MPGYKVGCSDVVGLLVRASMQYLINVFPDLGNDRRIHSESIADVKHRVKVNRIVIYFII